MHSNLNWHRLKMHFLTSINITNWRIVDAGINNESLALRKLFSFYRLSSDDYKISITQNTQVNY